MKKSEIRLIITAITTLVLAVICGFITIITFFGSLVTASKSLEFAEWRKNVRESVRGFDQVIDEEFLTNRIEDFNQGMSDLQEAYEITGN